MNWFKKIERITMWLLWLPSSAWLAWECSNLPESVAAEVIKRRIMKWDRVSEEEYEEAAARRSQ
mgnify:CR=1 FL=1